MKQKNSQHQIKKINIDFNLLNNKTRKKNQDNCELGINLSQNNSYAFKSILQKVCEAQSKKTRGRLSKGNSCYVSKRQSHEAHPPNQHDSSHPYKKSEKYDAVHSPNKLPGEINAWCLLNKSSKRVRRARQMQVANPNRTSQTPPKQKATSFLTEPEQKPQIDQFSVDPYTRHPYKYIENAQIAEIHLSRCNTSKRRFRNSITSSYKVERLQLARQDTQKRILESRKTFISHKTTSSQQKLKKVERKYSEVVPWEWTEQQRLEFL